MCDRFCFPSQRNYKFPFVMVHTTLHFRGFRPVLKFKFASSTAAVNGLFNPFCSSILFSTLLSFFWTACNFPQNASYSTMSEISVGAQHSWRSEVCQKLVPGTRERCAFCGSYQPNSCLLSLRFTEYKSVIQKGKERSPESRLFKLLNQVEEIEYSRDSRYRFPSINSRN